MKTTIDLPEDLLHRAKVAAAQRRTTLKELVIEGLEKVTGAEQERAEERARRLFVAMDAVGFRGPMKPLKRDEIYDRPVLRRH
jgi:signal transduction histidine kinase